MTEQNTLQKNKISTRNRSVYTLNEILHKKNKISSKIIFTTKIKYLPLTKSLTNANFLYQNARIL